MAHPQAANPPALTPAGPNAEWMTDCLFADMTRSAVRVRTERSTPV